MGLRAAYKEDLQSTPADMVYGETIRLPGEFLGVEGQHLGTGTPSTFAEELHKHFRALKPTPGARHGERKTFIFKELATSSHVFVRHDAVRRPLQPPYDGPFKVVRIDERTFLVNIRGREVTISVERLKPAFTLIESDDLPQMLEDHEHEPPLQLHLPNCVPQPSPVPSPLPSLSDGPADDSAGYTTRAGRRVRFPDRFQAGLAGSSAITLSAARRGPQLSIVSSTLARG